jgi:hypothetical protein
MIEALRADMFALADLLENGSTIEDKLLELELQSIASRLAEVGRRRAQDKATYIDYIHRCFRRLQGPPPWLRRKSTYRGKIASGARDQFSQIATSGQLVTDLADFATKYEAGAMKQLAPTASATNLREIAGRLEAEGLQYDVYVDNDPRESAGHAQWRRRPFGDTRTSAEPTRLGVFAVLADDTPSLAGSVNRMLVAIFALVSLLLIFLSSPEFLPIQGSTESTNKVMPTADAVVTILLLVPGLLLSRLDLPSHRTVLGRLRLLPRYLAYAALLLACALAVGAATIPLKSFLVLAWCVLAALGLLLIVGAVDGTLRTLRRRSLVPPSVYIPFWLQNELRRIPTVRSKWVNARFSSVRGW